MTNLEMEKQSHSIPPSIRSLRAVAFAVFAAAGFLVIFNLVVTVAPQTIRVFDKEGHLIGHGTIPHDYSGGLFWAAIFAFLAGIQLWTVLLLGRYSRRTSEKDES